MTDALPNPKGYLKSLPDNREVFVGHREGDDAYYIRFKNSEGKNTCLKISEEAFDALINLRRSLDSGGQSYWTFKNEHGAWERA